MESMATMPALGARTTRAHLLGGGGRPRSGTPNGRLYREVQFALPNELSPEARRELAGRFAAQLTRRAVEQIGEAGSIRSDNLLQGRVDGSPTSSR